MVVSLAPEAPKINEVSLDTSSQPTYLEETLDPLVERAGFALSASEDDLRNDFLLGHERRIREQAFAQAAYDDRRRRLQLAQEFSWAAARDGRPMTPEEREYILNVSQKEFDASPQTIVEKLYVRRLMDEILVQESIVDGGGQIAVEAEEEESVRETKDVVENHLTKQQIASTILSEVQGKFDQQNLFDKGVNILAGVVPFYSDLVKRDKIEGANGLLTGQNMEAQMRSLYLIESPEEFERTLREVVDDLSGHNLWEAVAFASNAVQYSGSDALWDNIFLGLDAVDVGITGIGVTAARLARRGRSVAKAGSSGTKSASTVSRQVLTGNIPGAARTKAVQHIAAATTRSPTSHQNLKALMQNQVGLTDPQAYSRDIGSLSNEAAGRLLDTLSRNQELLFETVTRVPMITRIGREAAAEGFKLAEREFRKNYKTLENSIVDVRGVRESEEVFGGTDHIEILIGTREADAFKTAEKAENFARKQYRLPEGSFTVIDEGGNFFIRMVKTVDETDLRIQDLRITTENKTPQTLGTTLLQGARSNQHLVSKEHAAWRLVATFGGNAVMERLGKVGETISRLGKNEYDRIKSMMEHERFVLDSGGQPIRTVGEFEREFSQKFQSMPSENETAAWFTYRQLLDFDHMVRNISVYRDKARLGIEQKSVGFSKRVDPTKPKGRYQYVNSEFFEGRTVQGLPTTQEPYTIAWIDAESGQWKFEVSNRVGVDKAKSFNEMKAHVESGDFTVIQVADPRARHVSDMIDAGMPDDKKLVRGEPVMYVAVRTGHVKTKPLSMDQVPYDPKLAYHDPTGFYVKQVRSRGTGHGRVVIDGETSVIRASTHAEALEQTADWEKARQLVARRRNGENVDAELQGLLNRLPVQTVDELDGMFRTAGKVDDEGVFSLRTPFVLTRAGQRIKDVRTYDDFIDQDLVDLSVSSHDLRNQMTSYGGPSDALGSQQRPIFASGGPVSMDAMEVVGRAGDRIARSRFYDDYIHRSVEDWANEFAGVLDVSKQVLMRNPMRYLIDPPWNDSSDLAMRTSAKNSRRAILDLLGRDTADQRLAKWVSQKVADGIYNKQGKKANKLLDSWTFNKKTDPYAMTRSLVFHGRLGLGNPLQFLLQGLSSSYVAAIDGNPLRAVQGQFSYWALRSRALMENAPQGQKALGKSMSKVLGVPEEHLDEMYQLWQDTGLNVIRGEYSTIDDHLNPKMFFGRGAGKTAYDASLFFFREGNNLHRGTAFTTAYLRWRQTNPTKRLDIKAKKEIIERTDLMYLNMTRAGNAWWQRGAASIPTQFFAFHARLMEELWGGRLTNAEKARVFVTMSALWGVPIGAGQSVAALWPVHEAFQQYALENGIDLDANVMTKFLSEGMFGMISDYLLGDDFNFSERYGPGGHGWLRDILDGEAWDVATGASGSFVGDVLKTAEPFTMALVSIFNDDDTQYPLTGDDVLNAFRNISTVNNAARAWQVWSTGQWMTRTGSLQLQQEAGDASSAIAAMFGMTPQEISDTYMKIRSNKQIDQVKRDIERQVSEQVNLGLKYGKNGDYEMMEQYFQRAHILMQSGDFTPLERGRAFRRAVEPQRSLVEEIAPQFVRRDPTKRLPQYLKEENRG